MTEIKPIWIDGAPWCDSDCPQRQSSPFDGCDTKYEICALYDSYIYIEHPDMCPYAVKRLVEAAQKAHRWLEAKSTNVYDFAYCRELKAALPPAQPQRSIVCADCGKNWVDCRCMGKEGGTRE